MEMWQRLGKRPHDLRALDEVWAHAFELGLSSAYWVSRGLFVEINSPLFIEFGMGYAKIVPNAPNGISGVVGFEPLVLEAAAKLRAARHKENASEVVFHSERMTPSIDGKYFEYLVGDKLFDTLLPEGQPIEKSQLLKGISVPSKFAGEWERPKSHCGRVAYSGDDKHLYSWMTGVLDAACEDARMRYPEDAAGPDIIAVLRDKTHTRVMVVLVQIKLTKDVEIAQALYRLDPAKMHHLNRGKPAGTDTGQEFVRPEWNVEHTNFLAQLASKSVPVMRVLVSGKQSIKRLKSGPVKHERRGTGDLQGIKDDLQLIIDDTWMETILGKDFVKRAMAAKE